MSNFFKDWTAEQVKAKSLANSLPELARRRGLILIKNEQQNEIGSGAQGPIPECAVRNEPVAEKARENRYPKGCIVSIESRRRRLTDPDNLIGKFLVDSLRYAGLIHGDSANEIEYKIMQTKVKLPCEEATIIEIEEKD